MKLMKFGIKRLAYLRSALSAWKGTSGTSVKDQVGLTLKSFTTAVRSMETTLVTQNYIPAVKMIATLRFGTLYFLNLTITLMEPIHRFQRKISIPGWD